MSCTLVALKPLRCSVSRPAERSSSRTLDLGTVGSPFGVEMRFDHPQPFVHAARDLHEDVVGIRIVQAIRLDDCRPHRLAERHQCGGERLHLLTTCPPFQRTIGHPPPPPHPTPTPTPDPPDHH